MIITDEGLEWDDDLSFGRTTGTIDTLVLGTGTVAEDGSNTLADMEVIYRSAEPSEAKFIERSGTTTECAFDLNAGQQVPLGTTITEIGAVVGAHDILYARDTLGGITLDEASAGRSFEPYFQIPTTR